MCVKYRVGDNVIYFLKIVIESCEIYFKFKPHGSKIYNRIET